jgi:hypothetical protein
MVAAGVDDNNCQDRGRQLHRYDRTPNADSVVAPSALAEREVEPRQNE